MTISHISTRTQLPARLSGAPQISIADFSDIMPPDPPAVLLTAGQFQAGPPIDPLKRIFSYDSGEWESFIEEWLFALKTKKKYDSIMRASGSNDRGIDVAAFTDKSLLEGTWDNYQCKHYGKPLGYAEILPEIGKILWHSFSGAYKPPRANYFVAPRNASTSASQLLANMTNLKIEIVNSWNKSISKKITTTQTIAINGELVAYVDSFDLSIFSILPVREIIAYHKQTPYYVARFGGGLPPRPAPEGTPEAIGAHESTYLGQLFLAYANYLKEPVSDVKSLKKWPKLSQHLKRQREAFYHAEALRVFVRDKVVPGTFETLQDEIYSGVADTCDADYPDGYRRVVAVIDKAVSLPLDAHPLAPSTFTRDRQGICHQLANDDRLKWTE